VAQVDRGMWASIVNNLVGNAVKYTREGEIEVGLGADDGHVVLTVSDTGTGIPLEQQPRIFDRFHRVDGSDRESGAGIGLAMVADAVRAHEGTVEVSSEPQRGSTFTVRLPQQPETADEPTVPAGPQDRLARLLREPDNGGSDQVESIEAEADAATERTRLLIVEDEADLRGYVSQMLAREGYDVTAAPSAEAALAALDREDESQLNPHLVLLDVMLPGKSGLELLSLLRQREQTARVPVIVLTGMSGSEAAVEALLAGADDYVVKPFDSGELLARVRAHRQAQELREKAVDQAETVAGQLRQALASNRTIGTAIGIVMARYGLAADRAFHTLVRISQQSNRKLREVADEIVAGGAIPGTTVARRQP
jgi:DNA-binding response OmpR family regulator